MLCSKRYAGHYYPTIVPLSLPWAPETGNIFLAVAPITAVAVLVQFVANLIRANMLLALADNPGMTIDMPKKKREPTELKKVGSSDDVELGDVRSVQRAALRARKLHAAQGGAGDGKEA